MSSLGNAIKSGFASLLEFFENIFRADSFWGRIVRGFFRFTCGKMFLIVGILSSIWVINIRIIKLFTLALKSFSVAGHHASTAVATVAGSQVVANVNLSDLLQVGNSFVPLDLVVGLLLLTCEIRVLTIGARAIKSVIPTISG